MHGGILVNEKGEAPPKAATREVLRGGTTIGYLERIAIVGAAAIGRVEVVAVIVAIKGLGRFSELDSAAARERFIIGTLVSMIWAGLCAALILLTPSPFFGVAAARASSGTLAGLVGGDRGVSGDPEAVGVGVRAGDARDSDARAGDVEAGADGPDAWPARA